MVLPTRESRPTVAERLGFVQVTAGAFKREMQVARDAMASGSVSSNAMVQLAIQLGTKVKEYSAARDHPGIAVHARAAFDDRALDYASELGATVTALEGAMTAARAALTMDAAGYVRGRKVDAVGVQTFDPLTKAETASVVAALDAAIATIG